MLRSFTIKEIMKKTYVNIKLKIHVHCAVGKSYLPVSLLVNKITFVFSVELFKFWYYYIFRYPVVVLRCIFVPLEKCKIVALSNTY